SSDVCSSDLDRDPPRVRDARPARRLQRDMVFARHVAVIESHGMARAVQPTEIAALPWRAGIVAVALGFATLHAQRLPFSEHRRHQRLRVSRARREELRLVTRDETGIDFAAGECALAQNA